MDIQRALTTGVVCLSLGLPAAAQTMTHTAVTQPDRISIGAEFIPRRNDLPQVLNVAAGQVVEIAADATYDYVEVNGTLRCARTHDTTLRVTTLIVMPSGTFDCGTTADPIPATTHVTIMLRNVPIDTTVDPFQWGNGLINFGHQTRVGATKLAWTIVTGDLAKGATTLTVSEDPIGWQVGDELLIPDTAQPAPPPALPRRESRVTIAAITGRVITLSKPLDFSHASIAGPDGALVLRPRVANLTRNLVIRSEVAAPAGVQGHTVNVGPATQWDIRYNEERDLGRTKNIPLDVTNLSTGHIGTNQVARYAEHDHHAQGLNTFYVGNAIIGGGLNGVSTKWCHSVHQTSDGVVQDEVCVGFPGAGEVTEDGNEVRVLFRHNFAAYSLGNHNGDINIEKGNVNDRNNPGAAGDGFWLRSIADRFEQNEAWDNAVGFNLFNQDQIPSNYPSTPGGPLDTPFVATAATPTWDANVAAGNTFDGFEYWGVPKFPHTNLIAANNGAFQFEQPVSANPKVPYLVNPMIICQNGKGQAVSADSAYVFSLDIIGGTLAGCAVGLDNGGEYLTLKNVRFQNVLNLNWSSAPAQSLQENVQHVPMPGKPAQYIRLGTDAVWNGTPPLPSKGMDPWYPQRGSLHRVLNWQGTGTNYQLFEKQSIGSAAAWPSQESSNYQFACPEAGLTMGQCWATYGVSYGHEAIDPGDVVPLEGLVTGLARVGETPKLGPPRLVVTSPTARASALVNNGAVKLVGIFTGDPAQASSVGLVSVDGDAPIRVTLNSDARDTIVVPTTHVTTGLHEVQTWRTDANQSPIGSPLVFHYVVGAPVPIPTVMVPNVVGQLQTPAAAALTAAGVTLGTVTTVASTSPAGTVLTQSPPAGASVNRGTPVMLVIAAAPAPPPSLPKTVCTVTITQATDGAIATTSTCGK